MSAILPKNDGSDSKYLCANPRTTRLLRTFLPLLALAGLIILGLLSLAEPKTLLAALSRARPGLLLASACMHLLAAILRAFRLHLLLDQAVPRTRVFLVANIGNMLNSLVPLRAGEFCMTYLFSRDLTGGAGQALARIFADRILDLMTVTIFFMAAVLLFPSGTDAEPVLAKAAFVCGFALVAAGGSLLLFVRLRKSFIAMLRLLSRPLGPRRWMALEPKIRAGLDGIEILLKPGPCLRLMASSLIIWFVIALSFQFSMSALYIATSPAAPILAMSFTVVGLLAMTTPAGIGTTHGAIVIALHLCGVPLDQGLAFAIVYHALATGLNVLLGVISAKLLGFDTGALLKLVFRRREGQNRNKAERTSENLAVFGRNQDL